METYTFSSALHDENYQYAINIINSIFEYDRNSGTLSRFGGGKSKTGTLHKSGYINIMIDGKIYPSHKIIWLIEKGYYPKNEIDHINHIRNDNRICNIREVTHIENSMNKSKNSKNTSGVMGVVWSNRDNRWVARIKVKYKNIHLGNFINKDDAIIARKNGERKYGFHCNHNSWVEVKE